MAQNYKTKDLLKNLPFFTSKIKKLKKRLKILLIIDFYQNYHSFLKKTKKLTSYQLSKELPFFQKRSKRPKRLTKHQIHIILT